MITSPYADIPLFTQTCPPGARVIPTVIREHELRTLRGQPAVREDEVPSILRELWAEATEEHSFAPSTWELETLRALLGTQAWVERMQGDPAGTLETLARTANATPGGDADQQGLWLLSAAVMIGQLSPHDLARPDIQHALEHISPEPSTALKQATFLTSALMNVTVNAPQVAWHWLSRLQLDQLSDGTTYIQIGKLDDDVETPCGPAPVIASLLVGSSLLAWGIHASVAQVCSPRLRRQLALASWRSGLYTRSRHPHVSLETLGSLTSPELRRKLGVASTSGVAARAAACLSLNSGANPDSNVVTPSCGQNNLLLLSSGQLMRWSHDDDAPQVGIFRSTSDEAKLHNLQAKFACIPIIRDEGERTFTEELAVASLILCASNPDCGLPDFRDGAAHLGSDLYELPRLNSRRILTALRAVSELPGISKPLARAAGNAAQWTENL